MTAQNIPVHKGTIDNAGRKQGLWTKLYDQKWNITEDTALVKYYRITEYDRPLGLVKDYYRSGAVQTEARLLDDRETDIFDGEAKYRLILSLVFSQERI